MLAVISPAKTLDFEQPVPRTALTAPAFLDDAATLAALVRRKSPAALGRLLSISDKLAHLNHERFAHWSVTPAGARVAIFAFMGDVYTGLDARSLGSADLRRTQSRLRILSGLYGLLRPFDAIAPYRLEMGTALRNPRGRNLYAFWGERLAVALNEQARSVRTRVLVNLASNEYFDAVDRAALELDVVSPVFKDHTPTGYRVVSFFAKRARGMMARFLIERRCREPADLLAFDAAGYRYNAALSRGDAPVFTRDAPT